jgi:hypothetical protein
MSQEPIGRELVGPKSNKNKKPYRVWKEILKKLKTIIICKTKTKDYAKEI